MPRIDLKVPFEEEDKAKQLGAQWDKEKRVWFVPDGIATYLFDEWIVRDDLSVKWEKHSPYLWLGHGKRYSYLISGRKTSESPTAYTVWRVYVSIEGGFYAPPGGNIISFGGFSRAQDYADNIDNGWVDSRDVVPPIPYYIFEEQRETEYLFASPDEPYPIVRKKLAWAAGHLLESKRYDLTDPNVRWELFTDETSNQPTFIPLASDNFETGWGGVLIRTIFPNDEKCLLAFDFSDAPVCIGFTIPNKADNPATEYFISHAIVAFNKYRAETQDQRL